MSKELAVQKEAPVLISQAESLTITDKETMVEATDLLSRLNKIADAAEEEKNKVMRPALDVVAAERKRWKPFETLVSSGINILRTKISQYQTAETKRVAEASKRLAERVSKGNLKMDTAARKMDEILKPEESVSTDSGTIKFRTTQILKITDETKIPRPLPHG